MFFIRPLCSLLLMLLLIPSAGRAQDCLIGIYADETASGFAAWSESQNGIFILDVYYIVHTEGYLLGAAWYREKLWEFDILGSHVDWRSYATYLETREEGWRIGLGTCHFGFGGKSITIMKETLVITNVPFKAETKSPYSVPTLQVIPNPVQNPDHAVVADCEGVLRTCEIGGPLEVFFVTVSAEGESFGKIKAMYR